MPATQEGPNKGARLNLDARLQRMITHHLCPHAALTNLCLTIFACSEGLDMWCARESTDTWTAVPWHRSHNASQGPKSVRGCNTAWCTGAAVTVATHTCARLINCDVMRGEAYLCPANNPLVHRAGRWPGCGQALGMRRLRSGHNGLPCWR